MTPNTKKEDPEVHPAFEEWWATCAQGPQETKAVAMDAWLEGNNHAQVEKYLSQEMQSIKREFWEKVVLAACGNPSSGLTSTDLAEWADYLTAQWSKRFENLPH